MTPITIWERLVIEKDETSHYEHNHIESGHSTAWEPTATTALQRKSWHGYRTHGHHGPSGADGWRSTHAYLDEHYRVIMPEIVVSVMDNP